jgi:hypothetical protein
MFVWFEYGVFMCFNYPTHFKKDGLRAGPNFGGVEGGNFPPPKYFFY